jgi:large subunit ribosomal protein L30
MTKLRITYTKSAIGYSQDQKDTVRSLGLRKLNSTALHDDTPAIRGMAFKIRHLVKVEELADEAAVKPAKAAAVRPVKSTLVRTPVAEKPAETEVLAVVEEPVVAATLSMPETPEVAEAPEVIETPAKADDLELIEGIGPKIASVLTAAGIVTFADLAAADTSRLAEILEQEPNLRMADPGTWPEQAALAVAGDWDAFKALTEQLKGGRRA